MKMSSYCMDQMALHRVECLSVSLRNSANLIVDKSGILKLDTWTLYELGEAFCIILDVEQHTNFHVLPIREQQDDLTANLQFAYDLLQKIKKLHIFTNPCQPLPAEQVIHLRCLRNLFALELDKVKVSQLKGLQNMRSTLQSLIVTGITVKLKQILTCCGADKATEYPWEKLKIGVFSHNKMVHLDSSLKLLPSIKVLDFSHCELADVSALVELETLKHLNLSFNKLSSIPVFKEKVCYSLLTLNISNNLICDLKGLEDLLNIEELNAANNLLGITESISPLRQLSQLRCLQLVGNPLTYNVNYRIHTLRVLNSATFFCEDLLLDDEPVGYEERKEISAIAEIFLPQHTGMLEVMSNSMQSIVNSTIEEEQDNESGRRKPSWYLGSDDPERAVSTKRDSSTTKRKRNHTRFVDIKDQNYEEIDDLEAELPSLESFSYLFKNYSDSHENDRHTRHADLPSNMHYIEAGHSDKLLEEILQTGPSGLFMADQEEDDILPHEMEAPSRFGETSLEYSNASSTNSSFHRTIEKLSNQSSDISSVHSEVEEVENDVIWLLAKKQLPTKPNSPSEEDVILVTSHTYFREKNALTNRTNVVWTIGSLESLEILSLEPPKVKINFRTNCTKNVFSIYTLAKEDFQTLKSILDPIMERNTMREIYKSTMNCMKCEAEFPKTENTRGDGKVFCPICGSGVVIMSTFNESAKTELFLPGSKNGATNISELYARTSDYREPTPMYSETGSSEAFSICSEVSSNAKKRDSDSYEESMSSVEVQNDFDEREDEPDETCEQLVQAMSATDARTLSETKLQESSSSGSMAGSICTAIDQSSTLNTPVHLKSSALDKCEDARKQNSIYDQQNFSYAYAGTSANSVETVYHNAATSLSLTGIEGCHSNEEVAANVFTPWVNSILNSLTGYSWSWWEEIVSKEDCLPAILNHPFSYNYEDPSCADHRIKLYAELILFTEKDEHLLGTFKATIMTGCDSFYCGFLLISNLKFYILETTGPEDVDLQSWFSVKYSYAYENLTVLCSLMHNQGFALRMSDLTAMILFGDSQRTKNAFDFVCDCLESDKEQISIEEWNPRQEDRLCAQLKEIFFEEKTDISVPLFILVTLLEDENKCSNEFLVLSCSQILLFKADLKWYYPQDSFKNTSLQFTAKEDLVNLSSIEVYGNTLLSLTFDRDDGTTPTRWNVHVVCEASMCQLIQGLKLPWFQLFGVELEVTDCSSLSVLSRLNNVEKPLVE